jgi:hypothetical protein
MAITQTKTKAPTPARTKTTTPTKPQGSVKPQASVGKPTSTPQKNSSPDDVVLSKEAKASGADSKSDLFKGLEDNYTPSSQDKAKSESPKTGEAKRPETIEQHQQSIEAMHKKMQNGEISSEEFGKSLQDFYAHSLEHHQQGRQDFENDWDKRQNNYGKRASEIKGIVDTKDDTSRNLQITQKYADLSQEMKGMLGKDAGANWSTWATWASKQAGQTIRQEDMGTVGKVGKQAADMLPEFTKWLPGTGEAKRGAALYDHSSDQIAKGNRKVFQEIAPHFARFAETFKGDKAPNAEKLRRFQEGFKPGSVAAGGQDLLKSAFTNYHQAMFESDTDKKKEQVFLANGQIGLHEQTRLQPEIASALPKGTRGLATDWMMGLELPNKSGKLESVPLGEDLPKFNGRNAPIELQSLQNPEADKMVKTWDKSPHNLEGSGADNWANIPDRMNFILDLFRSRHDDANLFQEPFSPSQKGKLMAGQIPNGPL